MKKAEIRSNTEFDINGVCMSATPCATPASSPKSSSLMPEWLALWQGRGLTEYVSHIVSINPYKKYPKFPVTNPNGTMNMMGMWWTDWER